MTKSIKFKRISAYIIDIIIIFVMVMLLSNIKFLNPMADKYDKKYDEFQAYYSEIMENINNETNSEYKIDDEYATYMYDLQYYGMSYKIIEIVVVVLYFTLFSYFNKGMTVGKRLMKIKLVDQDKKKKIPLWKYALRSLFIPILSRTILYTNLLNVLNVLILIIRNKNIYMYANSTIAIAISIYCIVDVITMLVNKENLSLHDKIFKTKVVLMEEGK